MIKKLIRKPHAELHDETRVDRPEFAAHKTPRIVVEVTKPLIRGVYHNGQRLEISSYNLRLRDNGFTVEFSEKSHDKFKGLAFTRLELVWAD